MPDGVYVDAVVGVSGTDWPIGTPGAPVDNITDAKTIATAHNTNLLRVVSPYGTHELDADFEYYRVIGPATNKELVSIDINGQSIEGSVFEGIAVVDTGPGEACGRGAEFHDCHIYFQDMSGSGFFHNCRFYDLFLAAYAKAYLFNCYAEEETATYILAAANVTIAVVNFSGYFDIQNLTGGTHYLTFANAHVYIAGDCTGGTLNIYGTAKVDVHPSATSTVNDYT